LNKALKSEQSPEIAPWQSTFRERKDLTKYGSNAIGLFALALKFGLEDLDTVAADAIVDGGNDKKLDLIYVDEEKRLAVVIQAYTSQKPKSEAPANKASDLNTAVAWVLSRPEQDLPVEIKAQTMRLRTAILNASIDLLHIWYVHNCPHSTNVGKELGTVEHTVKAAMKASFPGANIPAHVLEVGAEQFAAWYGETQSPILVHDEFRFNCGQGFLTKGEKWEAFVTALPASELYDVYRTHSAALFSANVRDYLGSRASASNINNSIKRTVKEHPDNFWVYNNGITALTNKIHYIPADGKTPAVLTIKGISIVNGAQTTGAIGALSKRPSGSARVPIRFVKTTDTELIQEIVRYNNSQNQITASDFRSTDRTQKRLKAEIAQIPLAEYEGGRRGGTGDAIKRRPKLLPSYTVGQALAAFHGDPLLAYNSKSEIWTSDARYSKYFGDHTSGTHIVFAYSLLRAVESAKSNLVEKSRGTNPLPKSEVMQLEFFRSPGATFVLVAAISDSLETVLARALTNRFSLSFGKTMSPNIAQQRWGQLIVTMLPFANRLHAPASKTSAQTLEERLNEFTSLVESTSGANMGLFQKFSNYVKHAN